MSVPDWTVSDLIENETRDVIPERRQELQRMYRDLLNRQERISLYAFDRNVSSIASSRERALAHHNMGHITDEEFGRVNAALDEAEAEAKSIRTKMVDTYRKINQNSYDVFTALGKNVESFAKEHVYEKDKRLRDALREAKKSMESVKSEFDRAMIDVNHWQSEVNRLRPGQPGYEEAKANLEKARGEARASGAKYNAAVEDFATVNKNYEAEKTILFGLTKGEVIQKANSAIKAAYIDIEATWGRTKTFMSKVHTAGEILTDGYGAYLKRFTGDAEEVSKFWKEARGLTGEMSEKETAVLIALLAF